jgi:hypothetical protein
MVGALSVSVRGQVQAVEPLLGPMSVVLALTNDLAALLALNELMATCRAAVRWWAWAVLLLAGGTAAGLNTWHAVAAAALPAVWAVVVGIGPVLLAVVLSHLVALVLDQTPTKALGTAAASPIEPTTSVPPPLAGPAEPAAAAAAPIPAVESSRAGQVTAQALTGPGVHHGLAVVPTTIPAAARPAGGAVPAGRGSGVDPRVAQLAAQLHTGADLTGGDVAAQLGCSERTGRRLLRLAQDRTVQDPTAAMAAPTPARERGTG